MKNCPKCNSHLRISTNISPESKRQWNCSNTECHYSKKINDKTILPSLEIAQSMANSFYINDSNRQRNKQANYRRIAGGINTLMDDVFKTDSIYLNDDEMNTLNEASQILERLASAAERAKKELKNLENLEEKRVLNREKEATKLIIAHFQVEDLITQTENTIIMDSMSDSFFSSTPIRKYDIESTIKRAEEWNKDITSELTTFLNSQFDDACRKLGRSLSHGRTSIVEQIEKSIAKSIANRDEYLKPSQDVFDMIEQQLKIEASKNIASLKLIPKN